MAKLLESTVQTVALDYLVSYYRSKAQKGRVWHKIEVRTRKKYGGKRADGLLAFKRRLGRGIFVASMEAKSYKTQAAITPHLDTWQWLKNSFYYATLIAVGSGAFFTHRLFDDPQLSLIYLANLWAALMLLVALVTRFRYINKTIPVYQQVLQYPAHEQWISTSEDSYLAIPKKLRRSFTKVLKARGVGLLIVTPQQNVKLVHKPKKRRKWRGHFLDYYSLGDDIRTYLN